MTAAQTEFEQLLNKSRADGFGHRTHPEDAHDGHSTSRSGSRSPQTSPSGSRMANPNSNSSQSNGYLHTTSTFDDSASMNSLATDKSAVLKDGYKLPARNFQANTGPKGVIADARSYEQARRRDLRAKSRKASMSTQAGPFVSGAPALPSEFGSKYLAAKINGDAKVSLDNWDRSVMNVDDDDEDFMAVWRRQRLQELQNGDGLYSKDKHGMEGGRPRKRYGRVEPVDASGYLDAIEKTQEDTVVVVLIYDDDDHQNIMLNDCLLNIARKHTHTRFVKLHYLEAEMDPVSTPAILAYKGGELFANLVSIVDEIPSGRSLSAGSIEMIFRQHQILQK